MVSLQEKINNAVTSGDVSDLSENDLIQLTDQFPYCGIFHELLAKLNHSQKSYKTENSINQAALFVNNRSAFFDFIFKQTLLNTFEKVEEKITATSEETLPNQNEEASPLAGEKESSIESSSPKEKIPEPEPVSPETIEIETAKTKESKEDSQPENEINNEAKAEMLKELEKQIISNAVSASIQLEASEKDEAPEEIIDEQVELSLNKNQKLSFSSWLKTFDSSVDDETEKQKKRTIIEKFIQNDPQITPKQTQFFSAPENAKLSLAEDETFVTETLAEIYAKQGNISKAVKAFEILMSKNPEKKVFFAARIKELKSSNKK